MLPSELAKPQSYLGVPWFCLECIGLMLSSVGLQWCSGHGALMISCRPSIALSACSPGETRTNINYVGSRMVSICMYIYIYTGIYAIQSIPRTSLLDHTKYTANCPIFSSNFRSNLSILAVRPATCHWPPLPLPAPNPATAT